MLLGIGIIMPTLIRKGRAGTAEGETALCAPIEW